MPVCPFHPPPSKEKGWYFRHACQNSSQPDHLSACTKMCSPLTHTHFSIKQNRVEMLVGVGCSEFVSVVIHASMCVCPLQSYKVNENFRCIRVTAASKGNWDLLWNLGTMTNLNLQEIRSIGLKSCIILFLCFFCWTSRVQRSLKKKPWEKRPYIRCPFKLRGMRNVFHQQYVLMTLFPQLIQCGVQGCYQKWEFILCISLT